MAEKKEQHRKVEDKAERKGETLKQKDPRKTMKQTPAKQAKKH